MDSVERICLFEIQDKLDSYGAMEKGMNKVDRPAELIHDLGKTMEETIRKLDDRLQNDPEGMAFINAKLRRLNDTNQFVKIVELSRRT